MRKRIMKQASAGRILNGLRSWMRSMSSMAKETAGDKSEGTLQKSFEFHGFVSGGWAVELRLFSNRKLFYFSDEKFNGFEIISEHAPTRIRTIEYYDNDEKLIGRSYFDRGDVKKEEVIKHFSGLDTNLMRGRPPKDVPLDIDLDELLQRVQTREDWYVHSVKGGDYYPSEEDALTQLALEYGVIHEDSSDQDVNIAVKYLYRLLWRAKKNKN